MGIVLPRWTMTKEPPGREWSRRLSRKCFHNALITARFTFVANRICKKEPSAVERAILLKGDLLCGEEFSGVACC